MSALSAGGSPAVALAEGEIFEDDEGGVVVEGELKKMKPHQKRVGVAGMEFLTTFLARRGKICMASAYSQIHFWITGLWFNPLVYSPEQNGGFLSKHCRILVQSAY